MEDVASWEIRRVFEAAESDLLPDYSEEELFARAATLLKARRDASNRRHRREKRFRAYFASLQQPSDGQSHPQDASCGSPVPQSEAE